MTIKIFIEIEGKEEEVTYTITNDDVYIGNKALKKYGDKYLYLSARLIPAIWKLAKEITSGI